MRSLNSWSTHGLPAPQPGQPRFRTPRMAQIGRRCGFSDAPHFARQFARLRGTTPRAFRAQALR